MNKKAILDEFIRDPERARGPLADALVAPMLAQAARQRKNIASFRAVVGEGHKGADLIREYQKREI